MAQFLWVTNSENQVCLIFLTLGKPLITDQMPTTHPFRFVLTGILGFFLLVFSPLSVSATISSTPQGQISSTISASESTQEHGVKKWFSRIRKKQERRAMLRNLWKSLWDEGKSGLGTIALILVAIGATLLAVTFIASISGLLIPAVLALLVGIILGFMARGSKNKGDQTAGSVAAGVGITLLIVLVGIFVLLLAAVLILLEALTQ